MRQVGPDRYPGVLILQAHLTCNRLCYKIQFQKKKTSQLCYYSTSRFPVQPNLPRNLNSSLGPKKSFESRRLGTCQGRRVRSPPEPPRNDIFALHADMSHRRNCNLQKFYDDKVKKRRAKQANVAVPLALTVTDVINGAVRI